MKIKKTVDAGSYAVSVSITAPRSLYDRMMRRNGDDWPLDAEIKAAIQSAVDAILAKPEYKGITAETHDNF